MAYIDVKNSFQSILNRRDLTPSQLTTFMQYGATRVEREVRCPAMEKQFIMTADGVTNVMSVPGDYLQVIKLSVQGNQCLAGRTLPRRDLDTVMNMMGVGVPAAYCRQAGNFLIGPTPIGALKLTLDYYADASGLVADTDANWLTDAAPDLLVYSALTYAADFFLDERRDVFEGTYQRIRQSLQDMGDQDELTNASVTPIAYLNDGYDFDYCYY